MKATLISTSVKHRVQQMQLKLSFCVVYDADRLGDMTHLSSNCAVRGPWTKMSLTHLRRGGPPMRERKKQNKTKNRRTKIKGFLRLHIYCNRV